MICVLNEEKERREGGEGGERDRDWHLHATSNLLKSNHGSDSEIWGMV